MNLPATLNPSWANMPASLRSTGLDTQGNIKGWPLEGGVWTVYYRTDALANLHLQVCVCGGGG